MKKKILSILLLVPYLSIALPAFAASSSCGSSSPQTLHDFLTCFVAYNIEKYISVLILVAVVIFLSGVVKFVSAGDSEEKRQSGRQVMVFGIIVLFVMISVWGIVALIYNSFLSGTVSLPTQLPALINSN
ncbi:MAG: hypothetical protein WCO18_00655 [bacterium]